MPIILPPINRRDFIKSSLALGGSVVASSSLGVGRDRSAEFELNRVALLADTHISDNPDRSYPGTKWPGSPVKEEEHEWVNMADSLAQSAREIIELNPRPANLIINGDCALSRGTRGEYQEFLRLIKPIREAGITVHITIGNHDNRENLWGLLPFLKKEQVGIQADIIELPHANLVLLDSGRKGILGDKQTDWLTEQLDRRSDKPALIFGHFNPLPTRGVRPSRGMLEGRALLKLLAQRAPRIFGIPVAAYLGYRSLPLLTGTPVAAAEIQRDAQGNVIEPKVNQPTVGEPLRYDATQGSIINANTDQKADQNQILEYVKDNPLKVTAGASLGFAAQEVPGAYKAARDLGRGRVRSTLGISGALKPILTTFGTPLMTGLYEGAIGAKRLDEGETMTDILTDPVGPALGLTLMEPLSKLSGVVKDAPKRTMLEGAKNYFNLSNVGQARPGITGQILRMGMNPRMIAGASRFLGLPGLALGLGMSGYDAYKNYQNQEGMIYNLFNKDE